MGASTGLYGLSLRAPQKPSGETLHRAHAAVLASLRGGPGSQAPSPPHPRSGRALAAHLLWVSKTLGPP